MNAVIHVIREQMRIKGMLPSDLAAKTGYDEGALSRLFSPDGTTPELRTIERLADGLNVDFLALIALAAGYLERYQDMELTRMYACCDPGTRTIVLKIIRALCPEPSEPPPA